VNSKAFSKSTTTYRKDDENTDEGDATYDTPTIEELMQEPELERRFDCDDDSRTGRFVQIEDNEPTADLLAPELLFPSDSDEANDADC